MDEEELLENLEKRIPKEDLHLFEKFSKIDGIMDGVENDEEADQVYYWWIGHISTQKERKNKERKNKEKRKKENKFIYNKWTWICGFIGLILSVLLVLFVVPIFSKNRIITIIIDILLIMAFIVLGGYIGSYF